MGPDKTAKRRRVCEFQTRVCPTNSFQYVSSLLLYRHCVKETRLIKIRNGSPLVGYCTQGPKNDGKVACPCHGGGGTQK